MAAPHDAMCRRKLTPEQVEEIRALRVAGMVIREIAERYDCGQATISDILHGRSWYDGRITKSVPAMVEGRYAWLARRAEAKERAEKEREIEAKRQAFEQAKAESRHGRDPDVKLYRREKNRRERRANRLIDEARAEFVRQLEQAAAARHPGRPKKNLQRSLEA
jgi:transposase